jgi:hypothetical protein
MNKECPLCHKLVDEKLMIWLNGLNLCKECYEERRKLTDEEAYIRAVIKDFDNFIKGSIKPLKTGARERIFKAIEDTIRRERTND